MAAPPNPPGIAGGEVAAAVEASRGGAASVVTVGDDLAAKAVQKEYERLATVRSKAMKGKGAWYWAHLEPILLPNPETGLPKAVKLRCSLCNAVFSASNPSRTASEHLKRGTCPNFAGSPSSSSARAPLPRPISSAHPRHHSPHYHGRKRSQLSPSSSSPSYQISPLAIMEPPRLSSPTSGDIVIHPLHLPPPPSPHLMTSGGKEDLGALAMLEDSVKRLKSPKTSPVPALTKNQVESAVSLLADWAYQSGGAVPFSSIEHPKFRAFLQQVGMPAVSRRDFAGARLDVRYEEARLESEARIRDALFFQLAAGGWHHRHRTSGEEDALVSLTVNLPNGASVFRRAVFIHGNMPPKYAEEVLWETVAGVCNVAGGAAQRCAGIVADRFKASALRDLESRNQWMVNLPCQLQAFHSLLKDIAGEHPLFRSVAGAAAKLALFFNTNSRARSIFHKHQLQDHGQSSLLRVGQLWETRNGRSALNLAALIAMLEEVAGSGRAIQMAALDDSYKLACADDPEAREVAEMIRENDFWTNLGAVLALIKAVKGMTQEMEAERPLVGQCLPLWDDLRARLKDWCAKFNVDSASVDNVVERRFKRSYHPAWSAAFILDPLYLTRDAAGKYLPQFKRLSPEQEKDVDKLITRLVSPEEAPTVLMQLMKWRTEGLDPLYAQAVQVKQRDPATGTMRVANPQSRRLVWETCLSEFTSLGKVAVRLIFMHATASGFRANGSLLRWVSAQGRSRAAMDRAQKLIFIAAQSKLERRDFSCEEDADADLFAIGEDDVLHDVFADMPSV